VLNERQKKTIEPYCTINDDVEMTPDDFLKLIRIVRHETPPSPTLSRSANLLDDARPRSSRLVGNRPTPSFSSSARMRNARLNQQLSDTDDDKESLDHPDAESDDISLVSVSINKMIGTSCPYLPFFRIHSKETILGMKTTRYHTK
jgi:hypothetical protein